MLNMGFELFLALNLISEIKMWPGLCFECPETLLEYTPAFFHLSGFYIKPRPNIPRQLAQGLIIFEIRYLDLLLLWARISPLLGETLRGGGVTVTGENAGIQLLSSGLTLAVPGIHCRSHPHPCAPVISIFCLAERQQELPE